MKALGYARDYAETSPEIATLFSLEGRVALVTGGASGLGRAMALGLARYGAAVAVVDLDLPGAKTVAQEVRDFGGRAVAFPVDVTAFPRVESLVDDVLAEFGQIDVLVNSAGTKLRRPILEMTPEEWQHVMDINLGGTFNCCKAVGRHMVDRRRGKVVNIASLMGHTTVAGQAAYSPSKGGVVLLTQVLAVEWAPYNIQVNCLSPVHIKTAAVLSLPGVREQIDQIAARIPIGRLGEPWEIIGPAVFLSSDASGLVTGHSLLVDGGWMAGGGPG